MVGPAGGSAHDLDPMPPTSDRFRVNNFDFIRLFAAMQVALYHVFLQLEVDGTRLDALPGALAALAAPLRWVGFDDIRGVLEFLHRAPGVPMFFFVSGFLISRSYETNSRLSDFGQNRLFRIYPALWACLAVSLALVALSGYFATVTVPAGTFAAWIAGQVTIVQFFNPDFLRGYGTGVLNGSLWTICVELQFYVLVPVLYKLLSRLSKARFDLALVALMVVFCAAHLGYQRWLDADGSAFAAKLAGVTFVPWVYMFLGGVLAQRNFERLHALLAGRWLAAFAVFAVCSFVSVDILGCSTGNGLDPLQYIGVSILTFATAYSWPTLAHRLLRGNDISYGLYIYHMPMMNFLLELGFVGRLWAPFAAIAMSVAAATASWFAVERPALALKKHPLNPLRAKKS